MGYGRKMSTFHFSNEHRNKNKKTKNLFVKLNAKHNISKQVPCAKLVNTKH